MVGESLGESVVVIDVWSGDHFGKLRVSSNQSLLVFSLQFSGKRLVLGGGFLEDVADCFRAI
jgi:hypothetical protein